MAKKKLTKKNQPKSDSLFALKLVLYIILGSLWLKVTKNGHLQIPVPVGLIVGLIFTVHEHFKIDQKIEYAVLLIAMLVGYWLPFGLYVTH
jgi:hypothetical protein